MVPLDLDALRAVTPASTAAEPTAPTAPAAPARRPLHLVEVRDANGQVCSRLPLPDDWQLRDLGAGRYELHAPGGIKANATESVSYAWSDDPFMRETIARTGSQLAPVQSIERIVRDGIEPDAERQGYRLTRTRELPGLQTLWQAILTAMPATGSRRSARVVGTEWQGPGDARSFIVVLQTVVASAQSVSWTVQTTELEAPAERFDDARDTWLDALAHARIDERWQQAKGMQLTDSLRRIDAEGRRWLEVSALQHRQRMADIAAAGEAARQAGRTSSEILDR
ncbi:MAG: hypothetical protein KAI24_21910, partial [Planctomycetes bacterium]|nr:hypothetical protein [Planctomycetota bacterium]